MNTYTVNCEINAELTRLCGLLECREDKYGNIVLFASETCAAVLAEPSAVLAALRAVASPLDSGELINLIQTTDYEAAENRSRTAPPRWINKYMIATTAAALGLKVSEERRGIDSLLWVQRHDDKDGAILFRERDDDVFVVVCGEYTASDYWPSEFDGPTDLVQKILTAYSQADLTNQGAKA